MSDKMIEELSHNEKRLLVALDESGGKDSPEGLISKGRFDVEVEVMGAASWLSTKGLLEIDESTTVFCELSNPDAVCNGLPERRAIDIIGRSSGRLEMSELGRLMPNNEDKIAVGWLKRKGLANIVSEGDGKYLVLTDAGTSALGRQMEDEMVLETLSKGMVQLKDLDPKLVKDLKGRDGMVQERAITKRALTLTPLGTEIAKSGLSLKKQVTDITDRMIQSGEWRNVEIRKYDVKAFAPSIVPAKKHPLSRLGADIRRIFTDMGFTEMSSEYVQPAFWNLDVLYTPQDHPARDLQDTFYLKTPSRVQLEDEELVEKVRNVHENGWTTGSTGWGGEWSRDKAESALLRTHSTVSSIRFIAEHPDAPQKAFSISRIFRNESIDSTHLPEFTQIEGIIIDENGNFDMLVSIIREFYAKMGFDQIRIRPAYFPYTEPSLELEVFFNGKWMELGGAGIFRPEVTEPFGVKHPVLAWGFGFERLAMLKWNIHDIRDLYIPDLERLNAMRVFDR